MAEGLDLRLATLHDGERVARDDNLLVGRNHYDLDLRVVGGKNLLLRAHVVALLVHLHAEVLKTLAAVPAHAFLVLAHAGVHTMMSTPFMAAA